MFKLFAGVCVLGHLLFLPGLLTGQTMTQLSPGGFDAESPTIDSKSRVVVYTSGGTLLIHFVKQDQLGILAQDGVSEARVSAKGRHVAFTGDDDYVGTNADGNQEIFLHDWTNNFTITQITNTSGGVTSTNPSIDKKGLWVAFLSDGDLVGTNADGNAEVFLYNAKDASLIQVTNTTAGLENEDPMLAATGKYVYFSSEHDLAGSNADNNAEIFRYVVKTQTIEQLTMTTNGDCEQPSPNKNGKLVAFESDSDELAGPNADGESEIYRLDTKKGTIVRLTDSAAASESPCISGNGKYVSYESDGDPLGTNVDGSLELFLVRSKKSTLERTQLTTGAVGTESEQVVLDNGGKRAFFQSDADLTGQGAGEDHIFYLTR